MSGQRPTRFLILWKLKSRVVPSLRSDLDKEASTSPNHRLDNSTLKASDVQLVPNALEHLLEFGLSPTEEVQSMRRIWFNRPVPQAGDEYVGLKMVFDTPGMAKAKVVELSDYERELIGKWREGSGKVGRHCRFEYGRDALDEGMGWEGAGAI
jgi:hypothetical protein